MVKKAFWKALIGVVLAVFIMFGIPGNVTAGKSLQWDTHPNNI